MNLVALLAGFQALWAVPLSLASPTGQKTTNTTQFKVKSLPNSPSLSTSWAGRIPIPDTEDGNALFFWLHGVEDPKYDDNLIIWLNGGPGCSSLIGATTGTGPVTFKGNSTTLKKNPHSWTKLGHVLYVDQPAGTGFSTASKSNTPYPAKDMDKLSTDFHKWLRSFFATFPDHQEKRLHLIGESYAGFYVPYIADAIVNNQEALRLNLQSVSLGDPTYGNPAAMSTVSIAAYIESQQKALHIPDDILSVFTDAAQTCGFESLISDSQTFPHPNTDNDNNSNNKPLRIPGDPEGLNTKRAHKRDLADINNATCFTHPSTPSQIESSIFNSTCDGPCALISTAMDYTMTRAQQPTAENPCFTFYDITNDCSAVDTSALVASYFSRADVQKALNIPPPQPSPRDTDTDAHRYEAAAQFAPCNNQILAGLNSPNPLPTPPSYTILPSLSTDHNVSIHVYSGENDMLLNHFGTELVLQNMTWRGGRGFSRKPDKAFYVDDARPVSNAGGGNGNGNGGGDAKDKAEEIAGLWGAERGVSYHLFYGAGHSVFEKKGREVFAFVRDVVVG